MSKVLPNTVVNYLGVDIDSTCCAQTEAKLANLPHNCKSIALNQGIEGVLTETVPKFDMVIVAHVHYYMSKIRRSSSTKPSN